MSTNKQDISGEDHLQEDTKLNGFGLPVLVANGALSNIDHCVPKIQFGVSSFNQFDRR